MDIPTLIFVSGFTLGALLMLAAFVLKDRGKP